jgi:beta-glucanase (GH16 family)
MILTAGDANVTPSSGDIVHYPAANLENDTYQPDTGWKLVWSDEFQGDSIDANNWNLQVVEAGRFNDEWQRYTNSSENAYVDNSCLVIKAVHESDSHGPDQYTSARLHTANKRSWKLDVRCKYR